MTWKEEQLEIGRKWKYPECCIEAFLNGEYNSQKITHNGFIPCEEHSRLSKLEIIKLLGRSPY